jgi:phosphoglycolate phosphatase
MTKRRFDVLIFDWDGTLFDSIEWIVDCLQQAADDSGIRKPSREAARSVIGLGLGEALQTLFPDQREEGLETLMDCYRRRYFAREISPADLFDGVPEMLEELRRQRFLLAVATGKARRGLDRALRGTGIAHVFSATRCADEAASKPHPAMLNQIIELLGVDRGQAVMIGDTTHDLQMAGNAGIAGIGVTCGAHRREELAALAPIACLGDVRELLSII